MSLQVPDLAIYLLMSRASQQTPKYYMRMKGFDDNFPIRLIYIAILTLMNYPLVSWEKHKKR